MSPLGYAGVVAYKRKLQDSVEKGKQKMNLKALVTQTMVIVLVMISFGCQSMRMRSEAIALSRVEIKVNGVPIVEDRKPLKAGDVVDLVFNDLPNTFYGMLKKKDTKPRLLASLPSNYTADGKYPVVIHLGGGHGGPVDQSQLDYVKTITADKDFIAVAMPLFKKEINPEGVLKGQLIGAYDDYPLISQCYKVMLNALSKAVPNIAEEGNVIGGFSNGGHTVGLLVSAVDPFFMKHFDSFYLLEGGGNIASFGKAAVMKKRFIYFVGDNRDGDLRPHLLDRLYATVALAWTKDITVVKMPGVAHAFPHTYVPQLGEWIHQGKKFAQEASAE